MYKQIITDEPDGFPLVLDKSVQFMQESWSEAIEALAAAFGISCIISGCKNVAGIVSSGFITVNGEMVYFVGGPRMNTFYVSTQMQTVEYEGGVLKPKLRLRVAQFGTSAAEQYSWTDWESTQNNQVLKNSVMPKGGIIMWSGTIANIPGGWALCNGQNGTPNLADMFIVGAGNTYSVGDTGGKAQHTLTVNEMPSHSHQIKRDGTQGGGSGSANWHIRDWSNPASDMLLNTSPTGNGAAHENRPPYYALAFIMKL